MRFYYIIMLILIPLAGFSQENYWQQEVNYTIKVSLNDRKHELNARIEMEYSNHSPDALDRIYIHLWPNAYSSQESAFAKELLNRGNTRFYDAPRADYGRMDSLDFTVNGEYVKWEMTKDPDIAVLFMPKPLGPEESIHIATPFRVKIPASFSRLGHTGQAYQITQWYPKPAVYDQNGWHPIPYRDQGEFYSEFGTYDVEISLPANYVVGATGRLQNIEELRWLAQKAKESKEELEKNADEIEDEFDSDSFPPSLEERKTLHYIAENVHDFAWFADKRYFVLQGITTLPGGKMIETMALFTGLEASLWANSIAYIDSGLLHYSRLVGDYRYPQCTAVEGALSAGAGMEYPMITIIGRSRNKQNLQRVLLHEIGHNWFYGMLGSNERSNPWMDEGINSYYESRYYRNENDSTSSTKTNQKNLVNGVSLRMAKFLGLGGIDREKLVLLALSDKWINGLDQPVTLHSEEYTASNYGLDIYSKTAVYLNHLEGAIGQKNFDRIMRLYFEKWLFRHPQPEDFERMFRNNTDDPLDWFFRDLMKDDRVPESRLKLKKQKEDFIVQISGKYGERAPVPVSGMKGEMLLWKKWLRPGEELRIPGGKEIPEKIVIDRDWQTFDPDRRNNQVFPKHFFKRSVIPRPHFLGSIEKVDKREFYFLPAGGWNNYDKGFLGLALYNNLFPRRPFHFRLFPAYSRSSGQWLGSGFINYDFNFRHENLRKIRIAVSAQKFSANQVQGLLASYQKLAPYVEIKLGRVGEKAHWSHSVRLRNIHLWVDEYQGDLSQTLYIEEKQYNILELQYRWSNKFVLFPRSGELSIENGGSYSKISTSAEFNFRSRGIGGYIRLRGFAAYYRAHGSSDRLQVLARPQVSMRPGNMDYKYDHLFFGRSAGSGFMSRQLMPADGGFRVNTSAFPFGKSESWLLSGNLMIPIPKVPFYLFADMALVPGSGIPDVLAESGIQLSLFSGTLEVYFPLLMSKNVRQAFLSTGSNYFQRITFELDLERLNPLKSIRELQF